MIETNRSTDPRPRRAIFLAALAAACLGGLSAAAAPADTPTGANDIVLRADRARGGGLPGIVWDVSADSVGGDEEAQTTHMVLHILAAGDSSVAETVEPVRQKGSRMLQVESNMWLTRPGLRKPVPISPRQRLAGQASVGDIAATNYSRDYEARLDGEEPCEGHRCHVLELTAKSHQSTYDRIRYWVTADTGLAAKAEFYSVSGKLLKRAEFVYANTVSYAGHTYPFVSRMVIHDALTPASTTLEYRSVLVQKVPASEFDVGHLD